MRRFIIFFTEKEGTTAFVHLLDELDAISVVHQDDNGGWEPFDQHNCGHMPLRQVERCVRMVYGDPPVDLEALNRVYTRWARKPLAPIAPAAAVGFKMRFRPPNWKPLPIPGFGRAPLARVTKAAKRAAFQRKMLPLLRELEVTVFVTVRQDLLRWALSKYHGDGTGNRGHLQFALAEGRITRGDIPSIHVDLDRLASVIEGCRQIHDIKRKLVADLDAAGVGAIVLRYEDFLADQHAYISTFLQTLSIDPRPGELEEVLERGTSFEKVHSEDIHDFVENADEVLAAFGSDTFAAW